MLVAFVALLVALGGTSYAVATLPARSVGTRQLKDAAVTRAKIKNNAVNGSKVARDALTGREIREASLAGVPSSVNAQHAAASDRAGSAAAVDQVVYRSAAQTVAPAPSDVEDSSAVATASCDAGRLVTGGGVRVEDPAATAVVESFPDGGGRSWTARVDNTDTTSAHNFTVYAVCVAAGGPG